VFKKLFKWLGFTIILYMIASYFGEKNIENFKIKNV